MQLSCFLIWFGALNRAGLHSNSTVTCWQPGKILLLWGSHPVPVCRPLRGAWTQPCWSSQPITEQPNDGHVQKILRASTEEPSDRPDGKCFTQKGTPKTAAVLINPAGKCEYLRALCLFSSIITLNKLKKSFLQQLHKEHRTCGDNYCWPRIKVAPAL